MTYSKENERYEYTLENADYGFDYIYTFNVSKDGQTEKGLKDVSNIKDDKSYVRLIDTHIGVKASLNMEEAKAGESVLVNIEIDNPENHEIKEVYLKLRYGDKWNLTYSIEIISIYFIGLFQECSTLIFRIKWSK